MKRCVICKMTSDEKELSEGIFDSEMIVICPECADKEGIPIIKKPSQDQLKKADRRYTVRERMERISSPGETSEISGDQMVVQGNLAKLRMPTPKEQNEAIIENYYWKLNMARRRKKLSLTQLSELIKIPRETLQEVEKGKIPENFEEIFLKLESFLGVKFLKDHKTRINFIRNIDEEKEILNDVRERMGEERIEDESEEELDKEVNDLIEEIDEIGAKSREETIGKIREGRIDFSKREDLSDVTLSDLVEMKKEKEKQKQEVKIQKQNASIVGDDLDIDIDEI